MLQLQLLHFKFDDAEGYWPLSRLTLSANVLPIWFSSIFSHPSALSLASGRLNPGSASARGADSAPHSASEAPGQDGWCA